MALIKTDSQHYTNIATKIREKTGGDETYTPSEMAEGVEKVFDAGKKAEYDAFWDDFQRNGNRSNYYMAFRGVGWTVDNFKPKYDIVPDFEKNNDSSGQGLFSSMSAFYGSLKDAFDGRGVKLDTQYVRVANSMFDGATNVTEIPHINLTSATSLSGLFYGMLYIKTISITLPDREINYNNAFRSLNSLENLEIDGTINGTNFNISWSTKLTHDALMNIINALADKSGDASGTAWAIVIGSSNLAKLTNEEIQIAQNKGWAVN